MDRKQCLDAAIGRTGSRLPLSDETVGLFYENLTSEEPWRLSLEAARVELDASNLMVRISATGGGLRDAIFAYGPRVNPDEVKQWEDYLYREIVPVRPAQGEIAYFNWDDTTGPKNLVNYMHRAGSTWNMVHCFEAADNFECSLIASRPSNEVPFRPDDSEMIRKIGRHMRRALRLRREFLRHKLAVEFQGEGLDRLSTAAILIDAAGTATPLNDAAMERIGGTPVLPIVHGRLQLADQHDDQRFQKALKEVQSLDAQRPLMRAMGLRDATGLHNRSLVIKGRRSVSMISGKPEMYALVLVRDVKATSRIDIDLTRQLFQFTRAEARLAAGIAQGKSLIDLESELNIRHNTARAHLRSMFQKTHVTRQAELVHLLANCVAQLGDSAY